MIPRCSFFEVLKKECKYGGNKSYNNGFMQGTAGYCYKAKEWTHKLKKCPLQDQEK